MDDLLCQSCAGKNFTRTKTALLAKVDSIYCPVTVWASRCDNIQCKTLTFTDEQEKAYKKAVQREYKRQLKLKLERQQRHNLNRPDIISD